jgi:nicotinamide mononucleotide transporter
MPKSIELIGFITGIVSVFLTIRRSPFCWPIGALNVLLYCYVFTIEKLYADAVLQLIFFVFTIYGWYAWTANAGSYKPDDSQLQVSRSRPNELYFTLMMIVPLSIMIGYALDKQTDAALPYFDSLLAMMSIWGQFLQTKKRIEHWFVWIFVDALYITLYLMKDLVLTSILYGIFLIMAVRGIIIWNKVLRSPSKNFAQ